MRFFINCRSSGVPRVCLHPLKALGQKPRVGILGLINNPLCPEKRRCFLGIWKAVKVESGKRRPSLLEVLRGKRLCKLQCIVRVALRSFQLPVRSAFSAPILNFILKYSQRGYPKFVKQGLKVFSLLALKATLCFFSFSCSL